MTDLPLTLLLGLTRRYPLVRGRDFFYRNFVRGKPLQSRLARCGNPVPTRCGFGIFCNGFDYTSDWIKVWGEHETVTEKFLLRHLRGGGAFLDVGANIGYFSLLVAHEFAGRCPVTAFEPNPKICGLLRSSAGCNRGKSAIEIVEAAVSDAAGELELIVDGENTGHAFLGAKGTGNVRVAVVKLDDWLAQHPPRARIAAIKLDVEGCELNALRGMEATLREHRPALVVEVIEAHLEQFGASVAEVTAFLKSLGYAEETPSRDDNLYLVHSEARA